MWLNTDRSRAASVDHYATSKESVPKPKRRKIEVACEVCRLRKSRCDGGRPKCGACLRRRNVGLMCVYEGQSPESLNTPSQSVSTSAEIYTVRSDSSPGRSQLPPAASTLVPQTLTPVIAGQYPIQDSGSNADNPSTIRYHQVFQPVPDQHWSRLSESNDDTANRNVIENEPDWILKAGLLAASSSAKFLNTVFGTSVKETAAKDDPTSTNNDSTITVDLRPRHRPRVRLESIHRPEYVLPTREVADGLLGLFFKHAYIQWIDRLRFMNWYQGLWTGDNSLDDPIDEQIHFATLNIIFALVYQTEPNQIAENQEQLALDYFLRAQKLLQLNVLDLDRLDLLHALLLLIQWFQSVNNVRRCTTLVGLCISIAHNLRLHIPERIESLPSQRQREMAKRAWHGCIVMDRITAMISGDPLQISQDIARQAPFFEVIDDEYFDISPSDGAQQTADSSAIAFFLAFCRLHLILGDVLSQLRNERHYNTLVDINHITEIDDSLEIFAKTLPTHLRFQDSPQGSSTYTGPIIHLHSRLLHIRIMLYRVFFVHTTQTPTEMDSTPTTRFVSAATEQGRLTCIRTAQQILNLISLRHAPQDPATRLVLQWWHAVTYVYTASTILIAAHNFPSLVQEITASSLTASLNQGFEILDHLCPSNESARRCRTALAVLRERYIKPGGLSALAEPWVPTPVPDHNDSRETSASLMSEVAGPSDPFRGDGLESFLFNTNLFAQEMNDWL